MTDQTSPPLPLSRHIEIGITIIESMREVVAKHGLYLNSKVTDKWIELSRTEAIPQANLDQATIKRMREAFRKSSRCWTGSNEMTIKCDAETYETIRAALDE